VPISTLRALKRTPTDRARRPHAKTTRRLPARNSSNDRREWAAKDPTIDPVFYSQIAQHAQTTALFDFYKQKYDPILGAK
jgi:hypothetical protein